jgi:hypothetical protein
MFASDSSSENCDALAIKHRAVNSFRHASAGNHIHYMLKVLCPFFERFSSGPVGIWIKIHLNPRSEFQLSLQTEGLDRKTFKIENGTTAVKAVYQGDVKLTTPLYLPLSIIYFFKVDESIKSVIDSYYLTKGKKERIDLEK